MLSFSSVRANMFDANSDLSFSVRAQRCTFLGFSFVFLRRQENHALEENDAPLPDSQIHRLTDAYVTGIKIFVTPGLLTCGEVMRTRFRIKLTMEPY